MENKAITYTIAPSFTSHRFTIYEMVKTKDENFHRAITKPLSKEELIELKNDIDSLINQ